MAGEFTAQFALNSICPYLGSSIDFYKAFGEFKKGNTTGGFVNVSFGFLNVATVGLSNSFKTAASKTGIHSILFEEACREGSKQTPWKVLHNYITTIISSGGYEVKVAISWPSLETLFTFLSERVLGIFKATRKDVLPVTMIPIMKLAEEAWKKYARKDLLLNYGSAILKGGINMMTNLQWDILASRLRDDGFFIYPLYPLNDLLYSDWSF